MADRGTFPAQNAGSDGCVDIDGGKHDIHCGVCHIFDIGGVPTISPLVVDTVEWIPLPDFTDFLTSLERTLCEAEEASGSSHSMGMPDVHQYPGLYTRLVSTSLPTRAPNV